MTQKIGQKERTATSPAPSSNIDRYAGFDRYDNAAAEIGGAVDVGPIDVGANSGYSDTVGMSWTAERGPIWLCGTNSGPRSAGVIHAQTQP